MRPGSTYKAKYDLDVLCARIIVLQVMDSCGVCCLEDVLPEFGRQIKYLNIGQSGADPGIIEIHLQQI